jgi:hypothetical protein
MDTQNGDAISAVSRKARFLEREKFYKKEVPIDMPTEDFSVNISRE